ncbi:MAG: alpha/beta fold hydrolase [Pseudomonadota bacterium]
MPGLHFVKQGQGPVVVLSHALGLDLQMWDGVAAALQDRFTVLRYDHRGHGKSPMVPGPCTMELLADDVAALIRAQCDGPVHFAGLSLGGMTAQALAVRAPELLASLCIVNSAAHYADTAPWAARMQTVRDKGTAAIADMSLDRWLTAGFRATPEGAAMANSLRAALLASDPSGYIGACEAIVAMDFRETDKHLSVPTLVVAGEHDLATPPALSQVMADAIPGARLAFIAAAHISAAERPAELAERITGFIQGL